MIFLNEWMNEWMKECYVCSLFPLCLQETSQFCVTNQPTYQGTHLFMQNFYASLPLPLPWTYPAHPRKCPCPPTSDYLLVVYLASFSKPHVRIMANKCKQGQVSYNRCRLDCRMKAFPNDQPTIQQTQPLKDVLLRVEKNCLDSF